MPSRKPVFPPSEAPPPDAPRRLRLPGRTFAAPSWVIPGSLRENCGFLEGRVDEVGILFFESVSSAAYSVEELPRAGLNLSFHVHLPSDLPSREPAKSGAFCAGLALRPGMPALTRAVLHPPKNLHGRAAEAWLEAFAGGYAEAGADTGRLCLENIKDHSLLDLSDCILRLGLRVCLDMGHVLAYNQGELVRFDTLMERVDLLHAAAVQTGGPQAGRHLPLTVLNARERDFCRTMCRNIPRNAAVLCELFDMREIEASFPLLRKWFAE